ncbi:phospholipase-like protein [Tanacetum coccineum]
MKDWMKKLQESTYLNTRNQNASLKNLETQIEQLAKFYQAKAANEIPDFVQVSKETEEGQRGVLPCQLPPKELNPESFTLPCTIGTLNLYAMADLGASVNIMPISMFNHLKLTNLKEPNMLVELDYGSTPVPHRGRFTGLIHLEDPTSYFPNSSQVNQIKPRPRDYSFKEWLKLKIGHKNVNKMVKNAVLNKWVFYYFKDESEISKDPYSRSLKDYKLVFEIEIKHLADEYELGIGKKGYVLDDIWGKCEHVHGGTLYSWHDERFKEEER